MASAPARLARLREQVQQQMQMQLRAPGEAAGIVEPLIRRAAAIRYAGMACHDGFGVRMTHVRFGTGVEL